jgi:hypothetical protein
MGRGPAADEAKRAASCMIRVNNAQSPYSYPWCAVTSGKDAGVLSCYYTSWEQCRTTQSALAETVSRVPITTLNRHSFRTVRW